jgi:hypothetical protein
MGDRWYVRLTVSLRHLDCLGWENMGLQVRLSYFILNWKSFIAVDIL